MARSLSRASRNYAAGTYEFLLDGFTKNDTDALEWTFTVEGWDPAVDPILTITGQWSDGTAFGATYPGAPLNRDGTPATIVGGSCTVPRVTDENGTGKVDVASGTVSVTLHADLRTAVTLEAISYPAQA
jgi:hypothetical protein